MQQDHGYRTWNGAFFKGRNGSIANHSRKDTKRENVNGPVMILCFGPRVRRFRPALDVPSPSSFLGK